MNEKKRIALLIDCDNVSHNAIAGVMEELAKYGVVNVRHAHGDWNSTFLSGWRDKLQPHAIKPIQQFAYTKGKNSTDSAMIIDAMDLLYSGNVDSFALMTSDCDFTPLALRIRESGLPVFGFGEKKTPQAFVDSCTTFIYTENLAAQTEEPDPDSTEPKLQKLSRNELRGNTSLVKLLRIAVEQTSDDHGWARMSRVGSYITNNSSFSPINYGYKKLGDLVRATDLFKENKEGSVSFIKDKRETSQ